MNLNHFSNFIPRNLKGQFREKMHVLYYMNLVYSISSSNEDIVEMILSGEHNDFGSEKLKGLMKILPEPDEVFSRHSKKFVTF